MLSFSGDRHAGIVYRCGEHAVVTDGSYIVGVKRPPCEDEITPPDGVVRAWSAMLLGREMGFVPVYQMRHVVGPPTASIVAPCVRSVQHYRELKEHCAIQHPQEDWVPRGIAASPAEECDCVFIPGLGFAVEGRERPYAKHWAMFHNDATGEELPFPYDLARVADILDLVARPGEKLVGLSMSEQCLVLTSQDGNRVGALARGAESTANRAIDVHVVAIKATDFPTRCLRSDSP